MSFLWIAQDIGYRFDLLERFPHLNKVYLPLLCITGALWYSYLKSLHGHPDKQCFERKYFPAPVVCVLLAILFYSQSAAYKGAFYESYLADFPSVSVYAATRLAELNHYLLADKYISGS